MAYSDHSEVMSEAFETLKRSWLHVRQHRYLWVIAFVIALAGGGAQGFSLWVQSPLPRGLTGLSPVHRIGTRITDFAHGNAAFWALFIIIGVFVGLVVLAAGAFAQASAIGAVSDIEYGRPSGLRGAFDWGKRYFPRFFLLALGYLLVLAVFAVPSYLFWWTVGKKGFIFPCLGAVTLGLAFAVVAILAGIMFELSARYMVLENHGIVESVQMAGILFKDFWREVALTWLYVLVITIMGTVAMAIVVAILSTPLSWIFTTADKNHNFFLIVLSVVALMVAWAIASAFAGIFSITASTMWTLTFIDLK
ncbi:MAG: DUF7544 domain-containing protein [Candidatus Geothermincolia bacterium]